VGLAARGSRQFGDKPEKIEDSSELAQVRLQARWVQLKALIAGIVLTALALALPLHF
jgi:hypothetical protein